MPPRRQRAALHAPRALTPLVAVVSEPSAQRNESNVIRAYAGRQRLLPPLRYRQQQLRMFSHAGGVKPVVAGHSNVAPPTMVHSHRCVVARHRLNRVVPSEQRKPLATHSSGGRLALPVTSLHVAFASESMDCGAPSAARELESAFGGVASAPSIEARTDSPHPATAAIAASPTSTARRVMAAPSSNSRERSSSGRSNFRSEMPVHLWLRFGTSTTVVRWSCTCNGW